MRVRWGWCRYLKKRGLVISAWFDLKPIERDGRSWFLSEPPAPPTEQGLRHLQRMISRGTGPGVTLVRAVLCGPGASMTEVQGAQWPSIWTIAGAQPQQLRLDLPTDRLRAISEPAGTLRWVSGSYSLRELLVLLPHEPAADAAPKKRFEILVASNRAGWPSATSSHQVLEGPPTD